MKRSLKRNSGSTVGYSHNMWFMQPTLKLVDVFDDDELCKKYNLVGNSTIRSNLTKKFTCRKCETSFKSGPDFNQHCQDKHKYRCTICGFQPLNQLSLDCHMQTAHWEGNLKCLKCCKISRNDSEYRMHLVSHAIIEPHDAATRQDDDAVGGGPSSNEPQVEESEAVEPGDESSSDEGEFILPDSPVELRSPQKSASRAEREPSAVRTTPLPERSTTPLTVPPKITTPTPLPSSNVPSPVDNADNDAIIAPPQSQSVETTNTRTKSQDDLPILEYMGNDSSIGDEVVMISDDTDSDSPEKATKRRRLSATTKANNLDLVKIIKSGDLSRDLSRLSSACRCSICKRTFSTLADAFDHMKKTHIAAATSQIRGNQKIQMKVKIVKVGAAAEELKQQDKMEVINTKPKPQKISLKQLPAQSKLATSVVRTVPKKMKATPHPNRRRTSSSQPPKLQEPMTKKPPRVPERISNTKVIRASDVLSLNCQKEIKKEPNQVPDFIHHKSPDRTLRSSRSVPRSPLPPVISPPPLLPLATTSQLPQPSGGRFGSVDGTTTKDPYSVRVQLERLSQSSIEELQAEVGNKRRKQQTPSIPIVAQSSTDTLSTLHHVPEKPTERDTQRQDVDRRIQPSLLLPDVIVQPNNNIGIRSLTEPPSPTPQPLNETAPLVVIKSETDPTPLPPPPPPVAVNETQSQLTDFDLIPATRIKRSGSQEQANATNQRQTPTATAVPSTSRTIPTVQVPSPRPNVVEASPIATTISSVGDSTPHSLLGISSPMVSSANNRSTALPTPPPLLPSRRSDDLRPSPSTQYYSGSSTTTLPTLRQNPNTNILRSSLTKSQQSRPLDLSTPSYFTSPPPYNSYHNQTRYDQHQLDSMPPLNYSLPTYGGSMSYSNTHSPDYFNRSTDQYFHGRQSTSRSTGKNDDDCLILGSRREFPKPKILPRRRLLPKQSTTPIPQANNGKNSNKRSSGKIESMYQTYDL